MSAAADYARRHRAENPHVVDRLKALQAAQRFAYRQLAQRYPAEYVALVNAECERLGVAPPGSVPTGRPPKEMPRKVEVR